MTLTVIKMNGKNNSPETNLAIRTQQDLFKMGYTWENGKDGVRSGVQYLLITEGGDMVSLNRKEFFECKYRVFKTETEVKLTFSTTVSINGNFTKEELFRIAEGMGD